MNFFVVIFKNRNDFVFDENLSLIKNYYQSYFGEYSIHAKEPNHYKL
jgi:hypothetical protein